MSRPKIVLSGLAVALTLSFLFSGLTQGATRARASGASIAVSYMASGTYDKAAHDVAAQLKKQGINVTVDAFPYAVLRQKNTTDVISGAHHYDVMSGSYYLADLYPHFASLASYMKKSSYGQGMIPGLLAHSEFFNGQPIGAPYGPDSYGLIYRTDLLKKYGIKPPKTWPQFDADLRLLKNKLPSGIYPYAFAAGANEQLPGLVFARYGSYFVTKSGHYALNTAKAVAAIKDSELALKYGPSNITGLSIDQANALFLQGKVAMMEGWPSFISAAASDPKQSKVAGKWGVAAYPTPGFPWLSLWQLYVPSSSSNKDAAWKWIEAYTSKQNSTTFFLKYGIGSDYTATYKDPRAVKRFGKPFLSGEQKNIARAKNPPLSGEAQDAMAMTLGDAFTGRLSPDKAVQQINSKWSSLTVPKALLQAAQHNGFQQK
ncbi:MAG: extracellular solute-binding protein [Chloroflexi bacterium]|nr:extracellular solute-binding protein [Chloroflexota bacterium]